MTYSSVEFLFLFFPIFLLSYIIFPAKNITYVFFSILFYFFGEGWFTSIVIFSVIMNFCLGTWIDKARSDARRRVAITTGVAINLGMLFYFKYIGFFLTSILGYSKNAWLTDVHLPLGISFFTFHAISYLVDIFRRDAKAERSFINLALYLLMFPQLIAGPILRFHTIARQLRRRVVTARHVYNGLVLFSLGMGQKVLLADTLAGVCDPLFASSSTLSTQTAWLAAITYTLQIFFDFGGYSNMAIGLGWITGFYYPRNFNYPYTSKSITEFWRRWHMTLSRWFRDYLYIPLGGNRHGSLNTYRNLITVFFLCGMWHGAAWTFALWGTYHGILLVIERLGLDQWLRHRSRITQHFYVMIAVVFGWVLFRSESIEQAGHVFRAMLVPTPSDDVGVFQRLTGEEILVLIMAIILSTRIIERPLTLMAIIPTMPPWRRDIPIWSYGLGATIALVIITASAIKLLSGSYSPFIYFRF